MHSEFDHRTLELKKALQFYEHQLFIHLGKPLMAGKQSRELDSFEVVKDRAKMHEADDFNHLKSKEAVALSPRDAEIGRYILTQQQKSKMRSLWQPDRMVMSSLVRDVIEKFEISNRGSEL